MVIASSAHMPRLDGLRALAIIGVLFEHFAPSFKTLSPGGAGVTLFFVLSGFLITRILMGYRDSDVERLASAKHFYWRRFCRLSPPFYLTIAVAVAAGYMAPSEWWVHALYLTNFKIGLAGEWNTSANHFWSLAVEEQFYLVWFFVVIWTPRRYFVSAIVATFAINLLFRSIVYFEQLGSQTTVLLPGNAVSLAAGALLAEMQRSQNLRWLSMVVRSKSWIIITAIVFAAMSVSLRYIDWPRALFYPLAGAAFFGGLIYSAAESSLSIWLDWLAWSPLRYIGKISYGIYVYHLFIESGIRSVIPGLPWASWPLFFLLSAASIGVAHVSWRYMEGPILKLKDRLVTIPETQKDTVSA
jgi:peptidoglycan/LPS O-acetylase OafA/YrhL